MMQDAPSVLAQHGELVLDGLEQVEEDLREGYISTAHARRAYGLDSAGDD